MRRYVRAILCIPMVVVATLAEAVEVRVVDTPGPVGWISETSAGVYARIANGVFRLEACANAGVCLRRAAIEGALRNAPDEGLPDGKVATASKGDLAKAWVWPSDKTLPPQHAWRRYRRRAIRTRS